MIMFRRRSPLLVLTHTAVFVPDPGKQCLFAKITNTSRRWPVQVTHVWLDPARYRGDHTYLPFLQGGLPAYLQPGEQTEVWVELDAALDRMSHTDALRSVVVLDSRGRRARSKPNPDVPPFGFVARPKLSDDTDTVNP